MLLDLATARSTPKGIVLRNSTASGWGVRLGNMPDSATSERATKLSAQELISYPFCFPLDPAMLPGLRLLSRIALTLRRDDSDCFTVEDNVSVVFGMGETPSEAIAEYASALAEYHSLWERDARDNKPGAQEHLQRMQRYVSSAG